MHCNVSSEHVFDGLLKNMNVSLILSNFLFSFFLLLCAYSQFNSEHKNQKKTLIEIACMLSTSNDIVI